MELWLGRYNLLNQVIISWEERLLKVLAVMKTPRRLLSLMCSISEWILDRIQRQSVTELLTIPGLSYVMVSSKLLRT